MTEPCRDWRGALGAAALGVIEPAEEIALRAHLDGCPACRAELRELTAVARALEAAPAAEVIAAPPEPSAALAGRVAERLALERGVAHSRSVRRIFVGAGAFTSVAAAVVAIVILVGGSGGGRATRVVMPGVGGVHATATATLRSVSIGTAVDVKVSSGLRPGHYYWLWITGDDGHRVAAGSFQGSAHATEIHLTAAVPLSEARRIWLTDGRAQVVLDARLPSSA